MQLEDGTWCAGEIRSWDRDTAGAWTADDAWTHGPGRSSALDRFAAERLRTVD